MKKLAIALSITFGVLLSSGAMAQETPQLTDAAIQHGVAMDKMKSQQHIPKIPVLNLKNDTTYVANQKNLPNKSDVSLLNTGTNNISFVYFDYGDIVFVTNPGCEFFDGVVCTWKHVATFDSAYQSDPNDLSERPFWSAYPDSGICSSEPDVCDKVGRQSKSSIRNNYDTAQGGWFPSVTYSNRYGAVTYIRNQAGEPFYTPTSKYTSSNWYCSKLPYKGYEYSASKNIDYNGGYWVTPDDIYINPDLYIFASGS
ncbi:hypothetical protein JW899_01080 [Candidatus Uhrbacteria bacterium]|nr:hypothetical protein [Candidatus Uhrbacteria bacterium]